MKNEKSAKNNKNSKGDSSIDQGMYLKFGVMIATSTIIMYLLMFLNTYQLSHVRWSETRFYMTLIMGSMMSVVMLLFMLRMYKNKMMNMAIVFGSLALLLFSTFLVRSQATVGETSWLSGMIPHHSIAILTSEKANIEDARVCRLAKSIIEAQKREISEMEWLIEDIKLNGVAKSTEEANSRPMPEYIYDAIRECE